MMKSYRLMLGERMLPIDMRSVAADEAGDIIRVGADSPIRFEFAFRGIAFSAQLVEDHLGLRLRLAAEVGTLPEDRDASELEAFVEAAGRRLGPLFRTSGRSLLFAGEIGLQDGLTAGNIVAGIAGFLAPIAPVIELATERLALQS